MKRLFPRARKSIRDCDWMKKFPYEFFMRSILSENLSKYEINDYLCKYKTSTTRQWNIVKWCMSYKKDFNVKYFKTTMCKSSIWSYPRINQHDRNCILILGRCRMTSGKIQLQRFITHFKTNVAKTGTGNGKPWTGNGKRETENEEQGQGTGNEEWGTGNGSLGTCVLRCSLRIQNFRQKKRKGSKGIQTSSKRNNLGKREFLPAVPPDEQYVLVRAESHWHWDKQSM